MRYFPLKHDRFEHQFGIRALSHEQPIIERTERFEIEVDLKRRLLEEDRENYVAALASSETAQQEAVTFISHATPELTLPSEPDAAMPLLALALAVQEDLVIMSGDARKGFPVIAGVVCFPSGWTITEKIGKPMLQVHQPVPEYAAEFGSPVDRLLASLKSGRSVWRMNWGVRSSDRLDQSPKQLIGSGINITDAGSQCYFRVERQTLSRLPQTNAILFTIHTHQCKLDELLEWQQRNLLGVLMSCPQETLRYKGIERILDPVCEFLRRQLA
ncbi:MAG: DUF3445 domain-containing protein [Rubripirellula sp.]